MSEGQPHSAGPVSPNHGDLKPAAKKLGLDLGQITNVLNQIQQVEPAVYQMLVLILQGIGGPKAKLSQQPASHQPQDLVAHALASQLAFARQTAELLVDVKKGK